MVGSARGRESEMAAIYRRGQVWWGRIRREGQEPRQSLKTTDRREAQKVFARWVAEIEQVRRGGKPNRTFEELVNRFIDRHFPTLRVSTQRRYTVSINHLLEEFVEEPIEGITSARLPTLSLSGVAKV